MKVYLSWSGTRSGAVAIAMRDWLPLVVPVAQPFAPANHTDPDSRKEAAAQLETADCAVVCVTPDNVTAPQLHFEAGTLCNALTSERIGCLLAGLRPADLDKSNPLLRFECIAFEHDEVLRLVQAIASAGALTAPHLEPQFEMWWPRLNELIAAALAGSTPEMASATPEKPRLELMVEELLELTRDQARRASLDGRSFVRRTISAMGTERPATTSMETPRPASPGPVLDADGLPVVAGAEAGGSLGATDPNWMDNWLNGADQAITPPSSRDNT